MSSTRTIIDGSTEPGNWTLYVTPDGHVTASKTVPYDGSVMHTTDHIADKPNQQSRGNLGVWSVVYAYHANSETLHTVDELIDQVKEVRGQ